jgi:hypothetical protein
MSFVNYCKVTKEIGFHFYVDDSFGRIEKRKTHFSFQEEIKEYQIPIYTKYFDAILGSFLERGLSNIYEDGAYLEWRIYKAKESYSLARFLVVRKDPRIALRVDFEPDFDCGFLLNLIDEAKFCDKIKNFIDFAESCGKEPKNPKNSTNF